MSFIPIVVFAALGAAVLGGAHYFLYFSILRFFSIINPLRKNALLAAIIILALSFIVVSLIAHWRENFFISAAYFASGFWLGFLTNLTLAAAAAWLIIWLCRLAGADINAALLGKIFFAAALAVSFYGTYNAFHPKIKNITVNIPNLPEQWKGKKVVQLSDLHLGMVHGENFMRGIITKINSANPDMVVITGDYFDGMGDNINSLAKLLDGIRAEKGIFYVTGNHEIYLGKDKAIAALRKTKVRILEDEVVDTDGLKIIGINYSDMDELKKESGALQKLKNDFYGRPNMLLYHSPAIMEQARASGVNLQLSGHTHAGQIFPFGYIAKLIYRGCDYGLRQFGDFTIYTTNGAGTWGPPARVGNTPEIVLITLK